MLAASVFIVAARQASPPKTIDLSRALSLEVADTNAKRTLGLGWRESLADDHGMLFVFDRPGFHPFWMKGMRFSLDIIWLRDGRIVDLVTLSPTSSWLGIPSHAPIVQADQVLELNAGSAARFGLRKGMKILLPIPYTITN